MSILKQIEAVLLPCDRISSLGSTKWAKNSIYTSIVFNLFYTAIYIYIYLKQILKTKNTVYYL